MLHNLTDEQINPDVAAAAKKRCRGMQITTMYDWLDGHFLEEEILKEAARQSVTLLTFDLKTIPPLLRAWGERGVDHGGVVFLENKGFAQNDISVISKALVELWEIQGKHDWKNQSFFLTPRG